MLVSIESTERDSVTAFSGPSCIDGHSVVVAPPPTAEAAPASPPTAALSTLRSEPATSVMPDEPTSRCNRCSPRRTLRRKVTTAAGVSIRLGPARARGMAVRIRVCLLAIRVPVRMRRRTATSAPAVRIGHDLHLAAVAAQHGSHCLVNTRKGVDVHLRRRAETRGRLLAR